MNYIRTGYIPAINTVLVQLLKEGCGIRCLTAVSVLPATSNVKLQLSSPITMGTVNCCLPRVMIGYWRKITVPYLEQENIVVTLCDSIGDKYRFGFNGQEKVNEWAGIGNFNEFSERGYDARLGRWLSVDPLAGKYPYRSPYNFALNTPTLLIDPDGKSVELYDKKGNKVATITKSGTVIEKGMEESSILKSYQATKAYFEGTSGEKYYSNLENHEKVLRVEETSKGVDGTAYFKNSGYLVYDLNSNGEIDMKEYKTAHYKSNTELGTIVWNPLKGGVDGEKNRHSPAMIFMHEVIHATHFKDDVAAFAENTNTVIPKFDNKEEEITITETNKISGEKGNGDGGNVVDKIRKTHTATSSFKAASTTSNQKASSQKKTSTEESSKPETTTTTTTTTTK